MCEIFKYTESFIQPRIKTIRRRLVVLRHDSICTTWFMSVIPQTYKLYDGSNTITLVTCSIKVLRVPLGVAFTWVTSVLTPTNNSSVMKVTSQNVFSLTTKHLTLVGYSLKAVARFQSMHSFNFIISKPNILALNTKYSEGLVFALRFLDRSLRFYSLRKP